MDRPMPIRSFYLFSSGLYRRFGSLTQSALDFQEFTDFNCRYGISPIPKDIIILCSHKQRVRLFCTAFSKAVARRAGEHAFLFVNFFFVPITSKKKWLKNFTILNQCSLGLLHFAAAHL